MDSEQVLGVIPNITRKKGFFGQEAFNLVVTKKRLIFAQLTTAMIKDAADKAAKQAKEEGKGLLGQMFVTATSGFSLFRKYFSMMPEDILHENPSNFDVDLRAVKLARVERKMTDYEQNKDIVVLTIQIESRANLKFNMENPDVASAKETLTSVLGNRVR